MQNPLHTDYILLNFTRRADDPILDQELDKKHGHIQSRTNDDVVLSAYEITRPTSPAST